MASEPVILQRTPLWLILEKPAGWHSVKGGGSEPDVESWLAAHEPSCADLEESGLVHRLDQPTSGCLMAATSAPSRALLRAAMSGAGEIEIAKQYLARCAPGMPDIGTFDLCFTKRHRGSRKMTVSERGSDACRGRCSWRVQQRDAQRGDLVLVDLHGPGRRHCIRAGLAFLGHPLAGDGLYGGGDGTAQLHAFRLVVDGTCVEAPPPPWAS
jgi:23S rRNA-/tRNA-specific pseudouridylate synthase